MSEVQRRKLRHIDVCLAHDVQFQTVTTGLEAVPWPYRALPEVNLADIDLSTTFLGKRLSAPLLIGAMTGGAERARTINRTLAEAAQATGIGLMLGSQRVMLDVPGALSSFQVRDVAPDILLIGNLGLGQLMKGYGPAELERAAALVGADAVAVHLNPLQEAMQASGDTAYQGATARLRQVIRESRVPLLVKEVGHGISGGVAASLADLPLAALDVAGAGGTSWARVEALARYGEVRFGPLCEVGLPTAQALRECRAALPRVPLVASGGIRSGLDMARALTLGAHVNAVALPFLPLALEGVQAVTDHIETLKQELRVALFVAGYRSVQDVQAHTTELAR
ncbi:type 2 isopentenyl-diphosphate Delta-isomerase [Deinococcus cavernae]|uniref:Isopentenyl-diphosphate delta-isomerase n=1 Tax=Deinococcus cavernae TaxID=2320857 RepID=A0A418UZU8_9DEIO|nr:type 2 isopentenyl-diphosphate Delta-isomerase [Deinococcus cavernae]RJF69006.1 type 2 isopentenyl-diphosphate Delta-isomerase [Deinococcus cavernae]